MHVTQIVKDRSGDAPVISAQGMSAFKGNGVDMHMDIHFNVAHNIKILETDTL